MKISSRLSKTIFIFLIIIIFMQCLIFPSLASASTAEDLAEVSSNINSGAVLLMEASTGKVIYEKNGYEKKYPASTTKILTAIIAIESCDLSEKATVSEYAVTSIPEGYTNANLQTGESLTIEDLLYALMLASANEAAVVLGEYIAGNYEDFATIMNEKATEIGCTGSNFVNANGMHDENHYTTAYDLALITQYAMKNETFRQIVSTVSYTLPATTVYPYENRTCTNSNALIIVNKNNVSNNYYYQYAIGVKTGYTTPAGNCLVAAANNNGLEFITVVLDADSKEYRYQDTISLFDFAFNNYSFVKLKSESNVITTVEVDNASADTKSLDLIIDSDIDVLTNLDNKTTEIEPIIEIHDNLEAPISQGTIVGTVTYKLDDVEYTASLVAANDVEVAKQTSFWIALSIPVGIILVILIVGLIIKRKYKSNKIKYKRARHLR